MFSTKKTLLNKSLKSEKQIVPADKYKIDEPNKNKLDDRAPKIKYLIPASTEKLEFFLNAART